MAKTAVSQWDAVAANNTDINSIPIDGAVTTPSQVDNIVREMMAQIKTFSTTVTISVGVSVDNAIPRFDGVAGALQGSGVTVSDIGAMVIESTDAGATGPSLEFKHSSASPAANDVVGAFTFSGKDSGGNVTTYAQVVGYIVATTDGAESGGVIWRTMRAGSFANRFILGLGLYSQGLSDPGDGKVNATDIQISGKSVATDTMSGFIGAPADKSYTLVLKCPFGGTINETVTKSASGTCTATFKINTTALGGTANSVSSSEQTQAHASANTFVAGDDIVLTISSNSSCLDMAFTIKVTKSF